MRGLILNIVVFFGLAFSIQLYGQSNQTIENDIHESVDTLSTLNIWDLSPLPVSKGPYPASWEGISRIYNVPAWWREAKFGAWSHWDPQSMPEQGDWYARGMYAVHLPGITFRFYAQKRKEPVKLKFRLMARCSQQLIYQLLASINHSRLYVKYPN